MHSTTPSFVFQPSRTNAFLRQALANINYTAYGSLIQHCTDHRLFKQGKQLHARITLLAINPHNYLASKLLTFYSKCGHLSDARKLFDQIPQRNLFSWNAMFIAYSIHHKHFETLRLFSDLMAAGLQPDNFTITCLLKSLSSQFPNLGFAAEIQGFVLRQGLDSDLFVSNALLTMYARSGDVGFARNLFDKMPERDLISWNSMISACSQGGFYEESLSLYREMVGVMKANEVTVVSVLQACSQLQDLVFGMEIHQFVLQDNEIKIDTAVYNSLIGFYSKCGSLKYARKLFDEMPERDEVSWGAMIAGYMQHGFPGEAMELFRQMKKPVLSSWNAVISGLVQNNRHAHVLQLFQEMQIAGFNPNATTISSILPAFSYLSSLPATKQIHCYTIRSIHRLNVYVLSALIDTYAKTGNLSYACRVFAGTATGSTVVWTAIIATHAVHGHAAAALALFNRMRAAGVRPDSVTFTSLLSACAHGGTVDEARRVFDTMCREFKIRPAVEHYACMVGVLGRAGKLAEAVELVEKMPLEPNAKVWGNLLGAASISGDVALGKYVSDRLFEIEPENSGNYIILANLYAKAGKWEDAENVREMMRKRGVKKNPGCSWIETNKELNTFVAGDVSNRRSEEIYDLLERLDGQMKEEGYVSQQDLDEENFL